MNATYVDDNKLEPTKSESFSTAASLNNPVVNEDLKVFSDRKPYYDKSAVKRRFGNETIYPDEMPVLLQDSILKHAIERTLALIAFLAFLPVMAVIYIRIKSSSKGPALFFQERVGIGGKTFRFVKFRTMYVDARERFPELYAYTYDSKELREMKFKLENDPRVTPEGVWLRKSSLDELPNLYNVITGQMAIVGPRPEIPEMIQYYKGDMLKKFSVRPGVTGLAQASGRGNLTFLDTVAFDVDYVQRKSWWLDIQIVFLTLYKVLRKDGAF